MLAYLQSGGGWSQCAGVLYALALLLNITLGGQIQAVLLLCWLLACQVLFRAMQHTSKSTTERSGPRLGNYEWQGVWESMEECLQWWSPLVAWNFTPEQVQNPEKPEKCLEKFYCQPRSFWGTEITVMCCGLPMSIKSFLSVFSVLKGKRRSLCLQTH